MEMVLKRRQWSWWQEWTEAKKGMEANESKRERRINIINKKNIKIIKRCCHIKFFDGIILYTNDVWLLKMSSETFNQTERSERSTLTHTHTLYPAEEVAKKNKKKKKEMWFLDIKSKLKVATKWLYCNLLNFDETLINSSEEEKNYKKQQKHKKRENIARI